MLTRILIVLALVVGAVAAAGPASAAMGMQITVITPTNVVLTLEVDSSDSIENVRQKIQDQTGTPPAQQILVFNSTVLEDGRTLADYGVADGATIRLSYPPAGGLGMQLFIRQSSGGSSALTLDVLPSDSTENLKTKIENVTGTATASQRIYYNGTLLQDGFTIDDYNVQNESFLDLVVVVPGGVQILVQAASTGRIYSIDVDYSDSIENVKTKVQDKLGLNPSQQRLYFAGRLLEDNRTLADYNVQRYNILVLAAPVPLTWTDAVIAPFVLDADYSDTVTAARQLALPTYAVTAGALPAGIALDSSGVLSGRPLAVGPYSFTITATRDDRLTIDQVFSGSVGTAAVSAAVVETAALAATGDDSILPLSVATLALLLGVALRTRRRA